MTSEPRDRQVDDPAGTSLADDLFYPARSHTLVEEHTWTTTQEPADEAVGDAVDDMAGDTEDDDYLELETRPRSRLTAGLAVALIFTIGLLAGVLITRALAPSPPPQVVYVLNSAAPAAEPTAPSTPG